MTTVRVTCSDHGDMELIGPALDDMWTREVFYDDDNVNYLYGFVCPIDRTRQVRNAEPWVIYQLRALGIVPKVLFMNDRELPQDHEAAKSELINDLIDLHDTLAKKLQVPSS